ncbi:MAG: hypothetical protein RBU37_18585 [Myxococcota bacterium]|jgi:tetratricopeptide (TPR) repeat protein|nr:hypothetical protein [Myxococcota bacterium]
MDKTKEKLLDALMGGLDAGIKFGESNKEGYLWIHRDRDGYRFDAAAEGDPEGVHLSVLEREDFRQHLLSLPWSFSQVESGLCQLVYGDLMRALEQNDLSGARDRLAQAQELGLPALPAARAFVCAYEGDSQGAAAALHQASVEEAARPLFFLPHGALWKFCHLAIESTADAESHRRHVAFYSTLLLAVGDEPLLSLSRALHWAWMAERSRQFDELEAAVRELERAISAAPEHRLAPLARINLARRLVELGRFHDAVPYFEAYLRTHDAPAIHEELAAARRGLSRS